MGLFSRFSNYRKKKFIGKLDMAINQVKHGTYNILFKRYMERFDRDYSGKLAAAVTNALFTDPPLGKEAEAFLEENKKGVETELISLKDDKEIGFLVADAVQTRALVIYRNQQSGSMDHNFGKSYEILRQLNFIKKNEDVTRPKLFITKAEKYFRMSLKQVKHL